MSDRTTMNSPFRVLVVDDSALMRKLVTDMLATDPQIEVIGQARDGADALSKILILKPDVITMDVEMPIMDGMETLRRIMETQPIPVIMLSSLTQAGAETTIKCLRLGAVDFVGKPSGSISLDIKRVASELTEKVKVAASVRFPDRQAAPRAAARPMLLSPSAAGLPKGETAVAVVHSSRSPATNSFPKVLLIGSSTGGPKALHNLVPKLPANFPVPIVIVQHLPKMFTGMLAAQLDRESPFTVREAAEGDTLLPGTILVAHGGRHLTFDRSGVARMNDDPPMHGVRPAIDITLASLIQLYGNSMVAVLLTGMGRDGALGMKALHDLGGQTIAEDESSCVVYGMPKAAVELKGVNHLLPLTEIPARISDIFGRQQIKVAS